MTLFRTLVKIIDDSGLETGLMDTISWNGRLWLVPKWQRAKTEGNRQPVRIIRSKLFELDHPPMSQAGEDYCLACAIPRAILDGQTVSGQTIAFDVVEAPEIEIPIPRLQ